MSSVQESLGDTKQSIKKTTSSNEEDGYQTPGKTEATDKDDDEDDLFADGGGDQNETKKAFKGLNKDSLEIYISKPIRNGNDESKVHHVVIFGPHKCWYNTSLFFKTQLEALYDRKDRSVPETIQNIDEFKLRVEYSQSNEQVIGKGKSYPKVRWYTVISVDAGNRDKLTMELTRLSKHFKSLHSEKLIINPGRRFMDYVLNSGAENILNGLKKYMGDDENVIMSAVNAELLDLGKKQHEYHYDQTLDRFMADYYTRKVLIKFLGATSWDSVSEEVKKVCFKDYPRRSLPDWNRIIP